MVRAVRRNTRCAARSGGLPAPDARFRLRARGGAGLQCSPYLIDDSAVVTRRDSAVQGVGLAGPAWPVPDGAAALYRGDALEVLAGIPDESVDCVWTDPPYMLSNGGMTCVSGRMASVNKGKWDESRGFEEDHRFNLEWTAACRRVLKPARHDLGDRHPARVPQRRHGPATERIPAAQRHRVGRSRTLRRTWAAEPSRTRRRSCCGPARRARAARSSTRSTTTRCGARTGAAR